MCQQTTFRFAGGAGCVNNDCLAVEIDVRRPGLRYAMRITGINGKRVAIPEATV